MGLKNLNNSLLAKISLFSLLFLQIRNTFPVDCGTPLLTPVTSRVGQASQDFAVIGVGVMGMGFAENAAEQGVSLALQDMPRVYDEKLRIVNTFRAKGLDVVLAKDAEELVKSLKSPRKIMILVNSEYVESVVKGLLPFLSPGDIVIDSANSHFAQTERLQMQFAERGIHLVGMGISGGASGARHGPSLMPGGTEYAVNEVLPILSKAAGKAKSDGLPAVAYMGPGAAGHIVKTVHNGIEYAEMQLIAEAYDLLKRGLKYANPQILDFFIRLNSVSPSYLLGATINILQTPDPLKESELLVDSILDTAKQKGTGKWTVQMAADAGVYTPIISAAFNARLVTALKEIRVAFAKDAPEKSIELPRDYLNESHLQNAFILARRLAFLEGFNTLSALSWMRPELNKGYGVTLPPDRQENYSFDLANIARTWREGCILQGLEVENFAKLFKETKGKNFALILEPYIFESIAKNRAALAEVLEKAQHLQIPMPAFGAASNSILSHNSALLPANLTQAQRDFFGSHTFERIDGPVGESIHHNWIK